MLTSGKKGKYFFIFAVDNRDSDGFVNILRAGVYRCAGGRLDDKDIILDSQAQSITTLVIKFAERSNP